MPQTATLFPGAHSGLKLLAESRPATQDEFLNIYEYDLFCNTASTDHFVRHLHHTGSIGFAMSMITMISLIHFLIISILAEGE